MAFINGGPGERTKNPSLIPFSVEDAGEGSIEARKATYSCVQASVIYCISSMLGSNAVKIAKDKFLEYDKHLANVGKAGVVVRRMGLKLNFISPQPKALKNKTRDGKNNDVFNIIGE